MSNKKPHLEPPDLARCQADLKPGSFMTFGPRKWVRCEKKPAFIAVENKNGKDGQKGSMSLCVDCAEKMKQILGENFATLVPVTPSE